MITLLIIALAVAAAVLTYLDIWATSSKFIYYALKEKNVRLRDRLGYISIKKALIWYGAWFAGTTLLTIFVHWVCSAFFLVLAIKGLWHWIENRTVMKRNRELQTKKLEELRQILNTPGGSTDYFWLWFKYPEIEVDDSIRYELYAWIYEYVDDDMDEAATVQILRRRIERLSLQDPATWFPK